LAGNGFGVYTPLSTGLVLKFDAIQQSFSVDSSPFLNLNVLGIGQLEFAVGSVNPSVLSAHIIE
jgi:hypothetical protein